MVLDGEIAIPDDRGVTHLDALNQAIADRRPERLAYFAFDLLHLDGHDLWRCAIEDRKMLLRDVIGTAGCERIVYVDTSWASAKSCLRLDAVCVAEARDGVLFPEGQVRFFWQGALAPAR